jgi:agmatinase
MLTQPMDHNFLSIEEEYSNYADANIVILPVPYEHSVSYGNGTANAPDAIIRASAYVEFYDDEYDAEICFTEKIATLPPINLNGCYDELMLNKIEDIADTLLADNKFLVTLGGEHTISIAPIKSHFKKHPNMSILHFDAHADLRHVYQDSKYSHACFMARICEFFPTNHITQVGIRALSKEERYFIKNNNINTFFASAIRKGNYGTI